MNKTLKDNKLDIAFLEGTIKDWKDYDETRESEEFKTINKMLNEEEYKNWECIYTVIKNEDEELKDQYTEIFNTILDRHSEIILEEYFDNTIILYDKTNGLLICEAVEEDELGNDTKFRVTLYKYNNSDQNMVEEKRQIETIKRRFIKKYKSTIDDVAIQLRRNEENGKYSVNYQIGINYIINSSTDSEEYESLNYLMGMEYECIKDTINWYDSVIELASDREELKYLRGEKRLMKSLMTFFKNAEKYTESGK